MHELDEEMCRHGLDILRYGPVEFQTGNSPNGWVHPNVLVLLIHLGEAEEFSEGGVTYVRVKEKQ